MACGWLGSTAIAGRGATLYVAPRVLIPTNLSGPGAEAEYLSF